MVLLIGATFGTGHAIARRLRAEGAGPVPPGRRVDELPEIGLNRRHWHGKGAAWQPATWGNWILDAVKAREQNRR
jgi:NADP-dependent 3-hydroxy acid dehydrogenase YdfG